MNVRQIEETESLQLELQALEARKKALDDHIYAQEAQKEEAMHELSEIEKEIDMLKEHMKKYGLEDLEGGRRSKTRRSKTHRSKGKKSKGKKSKGKGRRSKTRRSNH